MKFCSHGSAQARRRPRRAFRHSQLSAAQDLPRLGDTAFRQGSGHNLIANAFYTCSMRRCLEILFFEVFVFLMFSAGASNYFEEFNKQY